MEAMQNLMEQNMQNSVDIKLDEDEYKKDNVIYCKKCNTKRTTTINLFGQEKVVRCLCKCQSEENKEKEKIQQEVERQIRISRLQESSLLSNRYKNTNFENTKIEDNQSFNIAFNRCKKYCENCDEILKKGFGIYIYGDKGTGKTHLTACMANSLISQYKTVLFTNFFEISKSIRATFKRIGNEIDLINKISNVDFLFIDDLGTEKVTKEGEDTWLQDKIFEIINKRYNNMKPTIFTSNYSLQQLVQERGLMDKTVDRILEMSTAILKIEGKSNRTKRIENNLF